MNESYRTEAQIALDKAREDLAALFREREELEVRIAKQQRRLAALATLVDDSEETDQILELNLEGLTDAIRAALKGAGPRGLTPSEVKTRLAQLYFPVDEYENFRASLITVLKRLVKSGEVRVTIRDVHEGVDKSVYQWVGGIGSRFQGRLKSRFATRLKGRYGGPPVSEDT